MADNTTLPGTGEVIATDDLTTLNGGAVSGVKVQRLKIGFGSDATLRDVDASNGLPVVGTFWQTTQPVSGTFWQATQPVSFTMPALVAGSALIGKVGIDQTTPGTTNKVSIGTDGTVALNAALPTGTNTIGAVTTAASTSNGSSVYHLVSAATTNATNIKSSAGQINGWFIYNSNAAARKVVFHDTSGTPTAGASVKFAIVIPPNSGANVGLERGIQFTSGIALTTVTGLADSDATAVAANDLVINIFYD